MDIALSSGEVATILRALKAYALVATDDAYKAYAEDLIKVITIRWQAICPDDAEVLGD